MRSDTMAKEAIDSDWTPGKVLDPSREMAFLDSGPWEGARVGFEAGAPKDCHTSILVPKKSRGTLLHFPSPALVIPCPKSFSGHRRQSWKCWDFTPPGAAPGQCLRKLGVYMPPAPSPLVVIPSCQSTLFPRIFSSHKPQSAV